MFCPQCGSTQSDELKFCKTCGANLHALRQVMAAPDSDGKFDWSRTWLADMFMSSEDAVKHQAKVEELQGITPEIRRQREIKAGVITGAVGIGLMILLFVMMNGIIAGGRISDAAQEILSRLWIIGIIPLMVGAALIFNGMFVGRRKGEITSVGSDLGTNELAPPAPVNYLSPADTGDLASGVPFSVTDKTTRHLDEVPRKRGG